MITSEPEKIRKTTIAIAANLIRPGFGAMYPPPGTVLPCEDFACPSASL